MKLFLTWHCNVSAPCPTHIHHAIIQHHDVLIVIFNLARLLSSNLYDEEDFNAVIRHLPFFFHVSVSVCCTQSSRQLCHTANVPHLIFSLSSPPFLSLSHLICTQSKHKAVWEIKCHLALPPLSRLSPCSSTGDCGVLSNQWGGMIKY